MTADYAQRELVKLRARFGDTWEFWRVLRVVGGSVYCARRHDDHRHVLNADTPEELVHQIKEAEGEQ